MRHRIPRPADHSAGPGVRIGAPPGSGIAPDETLAFVVDVVKVSATEKPEIDFQEGPAPTELVITDLIVGDGAEAVPGGNVTVHYVGVEYDSGEQFDASWDRGESIEFPLRGLIQGWQDGIPGCASVAAASSSFRRLWPIWRDRWTPAVRQDADLRDRPARRLRLRRSA